MTEKESTSKDISFRLFCVLFLFVAAVALALRMYEISLRPFHSDEGVNFHFIQSIIRDGYYRYSHLNYHGPAYFYLTLLFTQLFGMGELAMRGSAILMGWGLIPLLLLLYRTEKRFFLLIAAILIAFSSSQIFHSRYTIHESLFVWSGALLGFSVLLWHQTRDTRYHLTAGLGLGLLIATKETFIITLFCLFFSFIALGNLKESFSVLWQQRKYVIRGLFLASCICLLLFSGGLQWQGGIREMLLAVPQWIGRNESDTGHFKPFFYYTQILFGKEILALFESIVGSKLTFNKNFITAAGPQFWFVIFLPLISVVCFPRSIRKAFASENATGRFFATWSFLAWLVYSCVNYKTPWLIINITLPLCLLLAWFIFRVKDAFATGGYVASSALVIMATIISLRSSYILNIKVPYGRGNPYSYVHTHQGMLELLSQIQLEEKAHGKTNILIGTSHYWPLPYYLREHNGNTGYLKTDNPDAQADKYDVMILDSRTKWKHDPKDWVRRYYRLSDVQESFTYFRIRR